MCGFIGVFDHSKKYKEQRIEHIEQASRKIIHRGPDDEGYYHNDYISLAFRRLSIVDLAGGKQPLTFGDGRYWIVFNGEIYNHKQLQKKLEDLGVTLNTNSDTEVIVALYSVMKEKVVHELRGMFAFLIWDTERNELFGARDYFGIKPLYMIETVQGIAFASESKGLMPFLKNSSINEQSLEHYTSFQYVPEPNTIVKEISKISPGSYFTWRPNESLQVVEYFHPNFHPKSVERDRLIKEVRETVEESVSYHMRSDVPVGSFLSGGIDSTIVATIASKLAPSIKTFSVDFADTGYSEMDVAIKTAQTLKVDHFPYTISEEEFFEALPKIIWHLDDIVADPAAIPLYFVAKEASKHVKVVLSGEGADELFGGYNIYQEPLSIAPFKNIPNGLKKALLQIATVLPEGMKGKSFLQRANTQLEERYIGNAKIFANDKEKQSLFSHTLSSSFTDVTNPLYHNVKHLDDISKMQYIDMMTWLRGDILVKADKMSMAHSLELRVPFLDIEVWKVASKLAVEEKVSKVGTKQILRKAFADIIPEHVVNRRKLGFPVPIRVWLKGTRYHWAKEVITESPIGFFMDKDYILSLLEEHRMEKKDHSRKLWTVLCFCLWLQMAVEQDSKIDEKKLFV
ncbi:asparagine synthase (glutamine-hydrolyzing) [Bacillus carboniphilus]|uniref:asparagine synthase (glutamine-hydrolyzing) n=1 Tax=Bacillus carboniphilus TaxID=86663 RepID=A0ABY9JSD7_9BACI|nr:asparagine synthase (glutamine-hydrolyzing) [Bacillus carboniphilus]WLR41178.1 asparagine synthase (glutamine-hydrolyzing) [Bacillus carboniphilus]